MNGELDEDKDDGPVDDDPHDDDRYSQEGPTNDELNLNDNAGEDVF